MRDGEEASSLIGDIYDASLEPGAWSDVFAKCARFVGGMSAILLSKDKDGKRVTLHQHDGGIAPRFRRLYSDTYARLDPLTVGHYFAEIDKPTTIFDLIPRHEFLRTRFYKEWVRPQRVADFVGATVEKSTSGATTFGVFRHERDGPADGEARARVRMLAPHVRRAVLIAQAIDRKTAEASTFADTLDGMSAGMFLIDQRGSIVHANASGRAMLSQGSVLRMTDGKLTAVESDAARTIDEAVATARNGDAALGVKGVAIPLGSDASERHVAHVLPLTSGARRRAGANYAAVAALFAYKTDLDAAAPPEIIAKTFKLTPSELRVLLTIVRVGGVAETAQTLGVGEATVKTHLHRVFAKTGTARQADFVKLLAAFSNPLMT